MFRIGVTSYKQGYFCISLRINGKRYRYYTGEAVGSELKPNLLTKASARKSAFGVLKKEFEKQLLSGWRPLERGEGRIEQSHESCILNSKLSPNYKSNLLSIYRRVSSLSGGYSEKNILLWYRQNATCWSRTSCNTYKRHIAGLEKLLRSNGYNGNAAVQIPFSRQVERLHVPYDDVPKLFAALRSYDDNLYLCSLLMFGCLLRPHHEIRLITRDCFSEDYKLLSIGGVSTKNGNNRALPVPEYVRAVLKTKELMPAENIFSGTIAPYAPDYFKLKWRRFSKSYELKKGQTLYSIRHTAALHVYKASGNLYLLQRLMGHSKVETTLRYLRGHALTEITEDLLPLID